MIRKRARLQRAATRTIIASPTGCAWSRSSILYTERLVPIANSKRRGAPRAVATIVSIATRNDLLKNRARLTSLFNLQQPPATEECGPVEMEVSGHVRRDSNATSQHSGWKMRERS